MSTERKLGWLGRAALLAAVLIVPACGDTNSTGANPGTTGAAWNTTSSGGGNNYYGPLLWIDPNLGPNPAPPGGGLDLTYATADAANYGPGTPGAANGQYPVSVSRPQDTLMDGYESTIVGSAGGAYGMAFGGGLGGAGGIGGIGGIGGGLGGGGGGPGWYAPNDKLRATARGLAKHWAMVGGATPPNLASLNQRLTWVGVNPAMMNAQQWTAYGAGMTGAQAWTAISGAVSTYIGGAAAPLWAGAGGWGLANINYYCLVIIQLPMGQIP